MESDGESEEYFVEDAFPSPVTRREDRRSTALPSNWDTNWSLPRSSVGSGEAAVDLDMIAGVDVDEDALVRVDEDVSSSRMAIPEERGGRTMEQRLVHLSERERNATQSYARDATFSIEACIKAAPTRLEAILFRVVESVFESRKSENLSAKVARCLEDVAAEHIPCEMDQTILDYGDAFSKFQGRKGQPFDFDAFRHSYSQNVKDQDRNICKSLLIFFRTGMRKEAREWLKKKEQHWRVASIWGSGELWKASCKHLARDQNLFPEERAVYGLLCGDFHPLFETCKTWEDAMWALCSCFSLPETQIHTWQGMMGTLDSFLKDAEIRISEEEAFFFECTKRFLCGLGDEEAENSFWQWLETQASKEESETESCREESSWSIQKRRVACHLSILFMPRDDDARDSVIIGPTQRAVLHLVMSYINALHETEIHYDTQIIAHYFNALSIHYPQVVQDGYARYLLELPEEMKRKAFESAKRCGLDAQAIFERVLGLVDDSFLENDAKESRDFEEFLQQLEIFRLGDRGSALGHLVTLLERLLQNRQYEKFKNVMQKFPQSDDLVIFHRDQTQSDISNRFAVLQTLFRAFDWYSTYKETRSASSMELAEKSLSDLLRIKNLFHHNPSLRATVVPDLIRYLHDILDSNGKHEKTLRLVTGPRMIQTCARGMQGFYLDMESANREGMLDILMHSAVSVHSVHRVPTEQFPQ